MSSQVFKCDVPPKLLYNLLDRICLKTDKYYLIDMNAYKKLLFYDLHTEFCENLKEYYHYGKHFYITRQMGN